MRLFDRTIGRVVAGGWVPELAPPVTASANYYGS